MRALLKTRNILAQAMLVAIAIAAAPVASAQVVIQPSPLPYGGVSQLYATTILQATGGGGQYQWAVDSGALPGGMNLNATGNVGGTPTQAGTFNFVAKVTAADQSTATAAMSVTVVAITTSASLPGGQVGVAYSQQLAGSTPNPTWSVFSGTVPGLSLTAGGLLSGTPTTYGTYNITIRANFPNVPGISGAPNVTADRAFTVVIAPDLPTILTSSLNDATTGVSFTQAIQGAGGVPPYTITGITGTLPPGLAVNGSNQLTGTPLAADTYNIQFRVQDSVGSIGLRTLQMIIRDPLSIPTSVLAPGVTGVSYTQSVQAAGGKPPYTMTVLSGLPPGLSFSASGNQLTFSGAPTTAQLNPYAVQFQVTDSLNVVVTKTLSLTVVNPLTFTTTTLPPGTTGTAYTPAVTVAGGQSPYNVTANQASLPPGLNFNGSTLTGTPTTAGSYNAQFNVSDNLGFSNSRQISITIVNPLSISTTTLPPGITATAYSQAISASGGQAPYTITAVNGTLPGGLTFNGSQLTGTPNATGAFNPQFNVTDNLGFTATRIIPVTVVDPLVIQTSAMGNATTGISYTQVVQAAGGQAPYTITLFNAPPSGLVFNGTALTGTPTLAGAYPLQFNVTDSLGLSASRTLTVTVRDPLSISTSSLSAGSVGVAYSQTIAGAGGFPGYTITATPGTLPPGLSVSSGGGLSGTPTQAGSYSAQFTVTDTQNTTASRTIGITITGALGILTSSLPEGRTAAAYSQTIQAAGGLTPYTITAPQGVPAGLSFNGTVLSGTPAAVGVFGILFQVTDANSTVAQRTLTLTVRDPLMISTSSLLTGVVSVAYAQAVQAAGGLAPYTITANQGTLPPGITFNGTQLTGTPTAAGNYNVQFTVGDALATTASRTLALVVNGSLNITTTSLPEGRTTVAYSQTIQAGGGVAPNTITATPASIPPGLAFNGTVLSGTPTQTGDFNIQFQVSDAQSNTATRVLAITIRNPLSISTSSLPAATTTVAYSQTVEAAGGLGPYTITATPNTLPPGISFNGTALTGTPTQIGTYAVQFNVTDSLSGSALRVLSLAVRDPLVISTSALPEGRVAIAYAQTIQAFGGLQPYTITATPGSIPAGLSFNGTQLAGTPTQIGDFQVQFQVSDAASVTASRTLALSIRNSLDISTSSLPVGTTTVAYSQTIEATGGLGPYTITAGPGSLPPGLSFNGAILAGTPTLAGTYAVQFNVTDSLSGSALRVLSLAVRDPLAISTNALPEGRTTVAYTQTIQAAGGLQPYTITATPASIPAGLSFNGTQLTGTPTQTGDFNVQFQVSDAASVTANRTLALTIRNPLVITTGALPVGTTTVAYSQTIEAAGGLGPYTITATPGSLPPGLTFNGTALAGTPTLSGAYSVELRVTDSLAGSATRILPVAIRDPLIISTSSLPSATARLPYSQTVQAAGGLPPYTITAVAGTLPAGLTFVGTTLSGTPTAGGSYPIQFRVTDAASVTAARTVPLNIRDGLFLSVESLPEGTVGKPYSFAIQATGGLAPYTITAASSSLPPGLSFDGTRLAGTPREGGGFIIEFTMSDAAGATGTFAAPINIFATTPDLIRVFPLTLRFNAFQGGAAPAEQIVEVTSSTGSIEQFTVSLSAVAQSQPTWLTLTAEPGVTPAQLHLRADPTGLVAGSYTATLSVRSGVQAPQLVPILFVINPAAPTLDVAPRVIQLSSRTVNPRAEAEVILRNTGGGAATTFEARLSGSSSWTRLSESAGSLSPVNPAILRLAFDTTGLRPGAYRDELVIRTGIGETRVPVSLFIDEPGPALSASAHGLRLAGREGDAANSRGTFLVRNQGSSGSTANWTATIIRGADVFTISPVQGATTPGAPTTVTIGLKPAATASAGAKSALLRIDDPLSQGTPEYVVLVADISASGAQPVVDLTPGGLVFTGAARAAAPSSQTISINTGAASLPFTVSTSLTAPGSNWLSVDSASGTTSATSPATLRVNVNTGTLAAGIYTGLVTVHAAGQVLSSHVTLIVTPAIAQTSEAPKPGEATPQLAVGCTPTRAVLSQLALNEGFSVPAGWPATLRARIVDDCGTSLSTGDIVATFSNGDAPIVLDSDSQTGLFTAAWQPGSVSADATVRLEAISGSLLPARFELRGSVKANPIAAPSLVTAGLLNNLNPLVGAAVAPGTITQIYGSNLGSSASVATQVPLPTIHQGVEAIIGGLSAPIYYASGNQLTVLVPNELVPNRQYSVILTTNSGYSQPTMLPVVPVQPGTVAINDGTLFATHGNSSRIDAANPSKPNEVVTVFLVGMGATTPAVASGSPGPASPAAWVNNSARVSVDGQPAEILFEGLSSGRIGLYQINFRIPAGARVGMLDVAISQNGVNANAGKLPVGAP